MRLRNDPAAVTWDVEIVDDLRRVGAGARAIVFEALLEDVQDLVVEIVVREQRAGSRRMLDVGNVAVLALAR
jgi:hypothetical protein